MPLEKVGLELFEVVVIQQSSGAGRLSTGFVSASPAQLPPVFSSISSLDLTCPQRKRPGQITSIHQTVRCLMWQFACATTSKLLPRLCVCWPLYLSATESSTSLNLKLLDSLLQIPVFLFAVGGLKSSPVRRLSNKPKTPLVKSAHPAVSYVHVNCLKNQEFYNDCVIPYHPCSVSHFQCLGPICPAKIQQ